MTLEHIRATLEYILNTMGDETVHQLIDYILDVLENGGQLTAKEICSRLHNGYHANDVEQTLADMGKARLVEKISKKKNSLLIPIKWSSIFREKNDRRWKKLYRR